MSAIAEFVQNNVWLCVGIGVVLVIVGDEVLGLSRGLFGDNMDDALPPPEARPAREEPDPIAHPETDEDEIAVEDLIPPRREKR